MFEVQIKDIVVYVSLLLLSCFVYFAQNQVLSPQTKLRFIAPPPDQLESTDVKKFLLDYTIQTCWKYPNECKAPWIAELVDLAKSVGCKSLRADSISGRISCITQTHSSPTKSRTLKPTHSTEFERKTNPIESQDESANNIQVDDERSALKRLMMMRDIIGQDKVENMEIDEDENINEDDDGMSSSIQLESLRSSAKKVPIILVKLSQVATGIVPTVDRDYYPQQAQHLNQQQTTRTRALRSGEWADPSDIQSRNRTLQVNRSGSNGLDGGSELRVADVISEGVTLVSSSKLEGGQVTPVSEGSGKTGEVSGVPDMPLECELRYFTYQARKTDNKGNTCTGLVSTSICYGGCDTGEIADWLFPHKKSIHKVCAHGTRMRRTAILPDCTEGASFSLREYHYVDAGDCACQKCYSSDTTCLGSPSQPNLAA